MLDPIRDAARRAQGYWFIDGLPEIGCGILFMLLSIPYLLWSLAPQGSRLARMTSSSRDIVLLIGLLALFIAIRIIKRRSTYPRSGYIEEKKRSERQFVRAAVLSLGGLLLFTGILVAGILLFPDFRSGFLKTMFYFPTIMGAFITTILVAISLRTGLRRFSILAGVTAIVSAGLAFFTFKTVVVPPVDLSFFASANPSAPMPVEAASALRTLFHSAYQEVAIFASIFGLAMLVSGLIIRRKYLQENPVRITADKEAGK